jgi:hypothetical protein
MQQLRGILDTRAALLGRVGHANSAETQPGEPAQGLGRVLVEYEHLLTTFE